MEKFLLTGRTKEDTLVKISLPIAKHFKPPTTDPDLLPPSYSIKKKSPKEMAELETKLKVLALDFNSMFKGHKWFHGPTLENCYAKHSFPVAQGPAVPPLDKAQFKVWENKSDQEVLACRTEFIHSCLECHEWIPVDIGLSVIGKVTQNNIVNENEIEAGFEVKEIPKFNINGAASLKDMSIVYTCTQHKCIIHCPCTVCSESSECKTICKENACQDCTSQCTQHETIGLPRLFDHENDHFTMITDELNFFRHAIPHPGIPLGCKFCTKDVHEHQILHHVFHLRCKFCRLEARPFDLLKDASLKDFRKIVTYFKNKDNRTCSYCFMLLQDSYQRKNHEKIIHLKESNYKCNQCTKSYLKKSALSYHMETHEKEPVKFSCDKCGKQYRSQQGLKAHKEIVHEFVAPLSIPCSHCDALFSTKSNLNRHMRSAHEDPIKINVDFVAPMQEVQKFECSNCEKSFNRKDVLKRHIQSVHSDVKTFSCKICSSEFHRKDLLTRHIKSLHK